MLWFKKSAMAERVLAGMRERLDEAGADITLEVKRDLKDAAAFKEAFRDFESRKDAIVVMRSAGAKEAKKLGSKVPVLFGAANDPVQLGVLKNKKSPEGFMTGVTYAVSADKSLEFFKWIVPDMKKLLLVVDPDHPAGPLNKVAFQRAADKQGVMLRAVDVRHKDEYKQVLKEAIKGFDAVIVGSQNVVQDYAHIAVEVAGDKPVFGVSKTAVDTGALGGFVADDYKLGRLLGYSLIDIALNGKPVSAVPVKTDENPKFMMNAKTMEKVLFSLGDSIKGCIGFVR